MIKERRHDIDWIRVMVFDLLILYHVGMFFVPWGWHIKNNVISEAFVVPMAFINQWRLPILFVISGMGTRFALSYRTGGEFISERTKRLLIPLLFGSLIIVAPQVYIERITDGDFSGSFWQFYPYYFEGIYPSGNFSWHHLWFLPYLFVFSVVLTPIFLYFRNHPGIFDGLNKLVQKQPLTLYLFTLPLLPVEIIMQPIFRVTHALIGDWYAMVFYLVLFFYGFVLISIKEVLWESLQKLRWLTLFFGISFFGLGYWAVQTDAPHYQFSIIRIFNLWSWILAVMGFSSMYLNCESGILAYRNQAVYPFYILHQTITVTIGFFLMNVDLSVFVKFIIMVIGTFGGSWLLYEFLIRKISFLRPLFGLKET